MDSTSSTPTRQLIWDKSTRIFHWSLTLLVSMLLASGLSDDMDWMVWHQYAGYSMLCLLILRVMIGIWGSDYARFSQFPLRLSSLKAYLAGQHQTPGHNPLGSWMIVVMLTSLTVQVFSGLLATDDFLIEGPWVFWASEEWVSLGSWLHASNWILISLLVATHLMAIATYQLVKKEDLIGPMISGYKIRKKAPTTDLSGSDSNQSIAKNLPLIRLIFMAALSAALTWLIIDLPTMM